MIGLKVSIFITSIPQFSQLKLNYTSVSHFHLIVKRKHQLESLVIIYIVVIGEVKPTFLAFW